MTIGEIKIEALKLMFATYDTDLSVDGSNSSALTLASAMNDPNYRSYLIGMNGSIQRAIAEMSRRRITQTLCIELTCSESEDGTTKTYSLSLDKPISLTMEATDGSTRRVPAEYYIEMTDISGTKSLIIPYMQYGYTYRFTYKEQLSIPTSFTNDTSLSLPDELAVLIPYYIKGDLYRNDDPNEASEARNWFEAGLDEIDSNYYGGQGDVVSVFTQGW